MLNCGLFDQLAIVFIVGQSAAASEGAISIHSQSTGI